MQKVLEFLSKNKMWLTVLFSLLSGAVAGFATVKITYGPVAKPEIHVILPDGSSEVVPVLGNQAQVFGNHDDPRVGMVRFKIRVANELAKEKNLEGVAGWVRAWRAVNKVKEEDIAAAAVKAGFPSEGLGDGQFLKRLIEWISDPANQEKIKNLIKFFWELAVLFVHAGDWHNAIYCMDIATQWSNLVT